MAEKKWCRITFSARLDDEDIHAMKKCFFDAMSESMNIEECADLKIEPESE